MKANRFFTNVWHINGLLILLVAIAALFGIGAIGNCRRSSFVASAAGILFES